MAEPTHGADRGLAVCAYLGPLVVVPLLKRKKDRFLFYHTRQGLYLFVVFIVAFLVTLGLAYLFHDVVEVDPLFRIVSVILLLEMVGYGGTLAYMAYAASRGGMPMLPLLGDLAGEG